MLYELHVIRLFFSENMLISESVYKYIYFIINYKSYEKERRYGHPGDICIFHILSLACKKLALGLFKSPNANFLQARLSI